MLKKVLSYILILLTAFILYGCGNDKPTGDDTPFSGDLVLFDFEKWESNFQLIRVRGGFGDVSRNEDAKYVVNGKYSAKLRPLGFYSISSQPYMVLPTFSVLNEFNYMDLRKVGKIAMKIYNSEKENIYVGVGLSFSDDDNTITSPQWHSLVPGWNTITYNIDPSLLDLAYNAKECYGIYLMFQNYHSRDIDDAPVLYLDDVVFTISATPAEIVDYIELNNDEICNFEKLYQEYVVSAISDRPNILPELSVVKASEYGIYATSGINVLRAFYPNGDTVWGSSPAFYFPQKYMENVDFSKYDADDEVCFDVYNNTDTAERIYAIFYTKGRLQEKWYDLLAYPKTWTTFRVTIGDLNRDVRMYAATNTGRLAIALPERNAGDRELFYDNFRIEKAAS